jgi:hypothetical protein
MALNSVSDFVNAELAGQSFYGTWRKTPTQTTGTGIWFDLSMSPGNPVPNYYAAAPNIAIGLAQSTDGGIPHGGNVSSLGYTKYLKQFMAMTTTATAVPLPMLLCDYLMFYPFVDMSVTDYQPLTTNIALPRYPTGTGVQIMAVEVAGQSGIGNPQFQVQYTNSSGTTGRVTPPVACNTQVVNGTIINTAPATAGCNSPFLPLQQGDTGVRAIEGITFYTADIGLISLVLVEVLDDHIIRTIDAPAERNCFTDFSCMPTIADDAYLNLICLPSGTLSAAPIHGSIQTIWG